MYAEVPAGDSGILRTSDDDLLLNRIERGAPLFHGCPTSVCPTVEAVYYLLFETVGRSWTVYGWLLLLGHWTFCSLVGLTILTFARSLPIALAVTWPLTVSEPLASGILLQFVNFFLYLANIGYLAAALLVYHSLTSPTRSATWWLVLAVAVTLGVGPVMLFINLVIAAFAAAALMERPSLLAQAASRRQLGQLLGATAVVTATYGLVYAWIYLFSGQRTPIGTEHSAAEQVPQLARLADVVAYGFVSLVPFGPFDSMPDWVRNNRVALVIGFVVLVSFLIWVLVRRPVELSEARRDMLARPELIALALIALAVTYAVMAITGRRYLTIWHMRYNATSVAFSMIVTGLALSLGLARFHPALRRVTVAVLLLASAWLTSVNAAAVDQSPMFAERRRQVAQRRGIAPSWVDDGEVTAPQTVAARLYSTRSQVLESGTWTSVQFDSGSFDPQQLFDGVSRVRVPHDGAYLVAGSIAFDHSDAGDRGLAITVNGDRTGKAETLRAHGAGYTNIAVDAVIELRGGDAVGLEAFHSAGRMLGLVSSSLFSPILSIVRLASADTGSVHPFRGDSVFEGSHRAIEGMVPGTSIYLTFERLPSQPVRAAPESGVAISTRGAYALVAKTRVLGKASGYFQSALVVNRRVVIAWTDRWLADGMPVELSLATVQELFPGDVVDVRLTAVSTGPVTILSTSESEPALLVRRIR